jgi:hypothetical protein
MNEKHAQNPEKLNKFQRCATNYGTSIEHLSEKSFCPIQTFFLLEKRQNVTKNTIEYWTSNNNKHKLQRWATRNEMTARNEKDETILNKPQQKQKQTQIPSIKTPNKQQTLNENWLYFLKDFGVINLINMNCNLM